MKKILCVISFCFIMIISAAVYAEGEFKISAEDIDVSESSAVVTLKAENNLGMAIGKIKISFDKDKLLPVAVNKGKILNSAWSFTSNLDDPNTDASEVDYVTASWMNMSNISGDGELFTIEFAIKPGASGTADISLEVSELADETQKNIVCETVGGMIQFGEKIDDTPSGTEDIVLGFSKANVSKTGSDIGGEVTISAYLEKPISAAFICTIFDETGKLLAVKIKNETLQAGAKEISLGDLNVKNTDADGYSVKVYMWNSLEGMKPLISEPLTKVY